MGIQINGQTDTITAIDGSITVGTDLTVPGVLSCEDVTNIDAVGVITARDTLDAQGNVTVGAGLSVVGVSTLGNTVVGGATTELVVNGDARITGILTIGTSSLTLDGTSEEIRVGTGVTFYGGNGNIYVNGNIGFSSTTNLYGDGTQSNPFKGLDGANKFKKISQSVPPDNQYWVEFNGVSRQVYLMFYNPMARSTKSEDTSDKVWMRVDSSLATIAGATVAMGHQQDVNPTISSTGIVGLDHIINAGCGEDAITYAITLPEGCIYKYVRLDIYRPHTIGQCLDIFSECDESDMTTQEPRSEYSGTNIGLAGATSSGQFIAGGSVTYYDNITDGPNPGLCAWNNSIFAENGGSNATTTTYDYDWLCLHRIQHRPSNKICLGYNCANEHSNAQTNLTHQWWVAI